MPKKNIAIVGATGLTGSELVRILHNHRDVKIAAITSESKAGKKFSEVHPFFYGITDFTLRSVEETDMENIDLIFLALPHGVSMEYVRKFDKLKIPMIDLSGDFRLASPEIYEEWYNKKHSYKEGFKHAVYGLPEINEDQIRSSRLIANPGCYPTCSILGLAPLVENNIISNSVIIDAKSGTTGAGIQSKPTNLFSRVNDNFSAYGLKNHRHSIEIQDTLSNIGGEKITLQFTPHLLPVDRGILSTIYVKPKSSVDSQKISDMYQSYYTKAPFVRLRKEGPAIKDVRGTNYCDIYTTYDERTGNIIVISVIDNLVKGAAGQAVQNMNLLFGWDQTAGLDQIPMWP